MDYRWILDDDIRLSVSDCACGGVDVDEATPDAAGGYRSAHLSYADGVLTINNCFVDVGDDFPRFLGIMDAAAEGVTFIGDCLSRPLPES
jgi:hypothetical protein